MGCFIFFSYSYSILRLVYFLLFQLPIYFLFPFLELPIPYKYECFMILDNFLSIAIVLY